MNRKDVWVWIGLAAAAIAAGGGGIAAMMTLTYLTSQQIMEFARNAGFTGPDLITAVAVALAESSGNPNAHGDIKIGSGTGSFGLWQIYADAHPEFGPDFTTLFDPQTNADAAFSVYSRAKNSFTPWSTFKNGAYLTYINVATDAANA